MLKSFKYRLYPNKEQEIQIQKTFGVVRQYTNQTVVIVESASYKKLGDSLKVKETNTQDSFNVISFDTKHKLIKIVRIGNHYDSFMRSKRTLVYNYETHTLISNA